MSIKLTIDESVFDYRKGKLVLEASWEPPSSPASAPPVTGIPTLGDPTLADAICDRLLHNAYRIELRDDSMRTRAASASQNERKEALVKDDKNELD